MYRDELSRFLDVLVDTLDDTEASPQTIAGRLHLSRPHLDRLTSAALGETPARFRRRILLERAAYALCVTSAAVIDVATDAGYDSREGFARAFTTAYGMAPGAWRTQGGGGELAAENGIHFQPPCGLRMPAFRKVSEMDTLTRMMQHHTDLVGTLVERLAAVADDVLDTPLDSDVEWVDAQPYSLRALVDGLVSQEERYLFAMRGDARRVGEDSSLRGLTARHSAAGPALVAWVCDIVENERLGDTFVRTDGGSATTVTFGGAILHVMTFGAVRRTAALRAYAAATGDESLGWGDPVGLFDAA
jgi:AraC-like DNA-binding protein